MAFSPYGTGINTYMPFNSYGYQPPVQTVQPEIQQVPQIQKVSNCEFIYVNGIQQVKDHIVQPNCVRYFLDNNDPIMYEKKADNLGSSQIRIYSMTEVNANNTQNMQQQGVVTRDEFNILSEKINQLEQQLKEAGVHESISTKSYFEPDKYLPE